MILHLTRKEKFTKPFIDFIKENFDIHNHLFLLVGGQQNKNFELDETSYIKVINNKQEFLKYFINFNIQMYKADKIIIHGLSQPYNIIYLFFNPWLLKKCYWMLWGGDLYSYKLSQRTLRWYILEFFKKPIIKNIGYITTTIPGDYYLAQQWYNTKASYIQNLMYPSHVARSFNFLLNNNHSLINIQIGNSADSSHKHIEVFNMLLKYKDENIKIWVPLSYGDEIYADKVIKKGMELFGDKFVPLIDFMNFEDYNLYLASIDIAFFNYDRQQAMGNIIGLLSLGKTVYLKSSITPYKYFVDLGIKICVLKHNNITINKISNQDSLNNKNICASFFNLDNLKNNWEKIIND